MDRTLLSSLIRSAGIAVAAFAVGVGAYNLFKYRKKRAIAPGEDDGASNIYVPEVDITIDKNYFRRVNLSEALRDFEKVFH